MKTKFILLAVLTASTAFLSCKKKGCTDEAAVNFEEKAKKDDGSCNFMPMITIVGANPASVNVGANYNDAGATAFVKNGGTVDVTTDLSEVNTSSTGSFNIIYSASNEHGTATATRLVNVILGQSSYLGTYTTESECSALEFPHTASPVVEAGSNSNELVINGAFTLIGGTITMIISGANITVPPSEVPIPLLGTLYFSGTGTMNATGTQMVISYDYDGPAGQGVCVVTYNK
jgi:hypothetical protein